MSREVAAPPGLPSQTATARRDPEVFDAMSKSRSLTAA